MTRVPWITNFQNYILISPFRKFYQYISPVKGESVIFQTCSKDMPESRFEPVIHGPINYYQSSIFRISGARIIGQKTTWLSGGFLVNRSFSFWAAQLQIAFSKTYCKFYIHIYLIIFILFINFKNRMIMRSRNLLDFLEFWLIRFLELYLTHPRRKSVRSGRSPQVW